MKEEPAPNKKDDDVPDPLTVSDEEQQEDEPVDTVLLHAATLSMAIDHLPANVGQWRRIIEQHYRRATLKFHPDKGGSEELFDQLEKAKAYLFEWAAKWVVIDKAFPKLNKLCYCAKCTDMWDRMSGCKWCLGVTTNTATQVGAKLIMVSGQPQDISGEIVVLTTANICCSFRMAPQSRLPSMPSRRRRKCSCRWPKGPRNFVKKNGGSRGSFFVMDAKRAQELCCDGCQSPF